MKDDNSALQDASIDTNRCAIGNDGCEDRKTREDMVSRNLILETNPSQTDNSSVTEVKDSNVRSLQNASSQHAIKGVIVDVTNIVSEGLDMLVPTHKTTLGTVLRPQTLAVLATLREKAYSSSTHRALASRRKLIDEFCRETGTTLPFTPQVTIVLIASLVEAKYTYSYISSILWALRRIHRDAELPDPTGDPHVVRMLRGARRTLGDVPTRKAPLLSEHIHQICEMAAEHPNSAIAVRDPAMFSLHYAGALRGHCGTLLRIENIEWAADGSSVTVRLFGTKTDRRHRGQEVQIGATGTSACPVLLLRNLINAMGRTTGPVFTSVSRAGQFGSDPLTTTALRSIVKSYVKRLGLDPKEYGVHSLRAGCVTSAVQAGIAEVDIMEHTRHVSIDSFRQYYRPQTKPNLSKALGL